VSEHVALLIAEGATVGGILLFLFRLRRVIGLAPLYLVVGALQYLQIVFAALVRFEVAPGILISPAAVVLFPVTTVVVLLTYVERDADETRKLAYGIVISNLALYAVSGFVGLHLIAEGGSLPEGLPAGLFAQSWRTALVSTATLFVDVIGAVVAFELVSRYLSQSLFLRLWTSAIIVMALDSVLFTTAAFYGRDGFMAMLLAGFLAKCAGATFYAALIAGYVRWLDEPRTQTAGALTGSDAFQWLTYRQRYEEARSLMARDSLTGLYNRSFFDDHAQRQVAQAVRAKRQMSLVMIDVDRLKEVNDRHGHRVGDDLIRTVANTLKQCVRAADAACRYGGDEFVVVLSTASPESAAVFSNRVLQDLAAAAGDRQPLPAWAPASVSIGVATCPDDGATVEELVNCADARLYSAKAQGGTRAVVSELDAGKVMAPGRPSS
jgi:diguanylate cyclase (GGDEF)-like protein